MADLLSHALCSGMVARLLLENLSPEDFPEQQHQRVIFEAISESVATTGGIDHTRIAETVGWDTLHPLLARNCRIFLDGVFSAIREIRTRKMRGEALALMRRGDDAGAASILSRLATPGPQAEQIPGRISAAVASRFLEEIERNRKREFLGPKTGIPQLDRITLGLAPSTIEAVGAPTSAGKTQLLCQFANEAILQGASIAYFSLEMPPPWILSRMIGANQRINPTRIFMGNLKDEERTSVGSVLGLYADLPLYIFRNRTEIGEIADTAREIRRREGKLDVAVVDFLQNVGVRGVSSTTERMAIAAVELQALAGELGTCILVASQLSNEAVREQGGGILSFRYASELAHASDVAMELVPRKDGTTDLLVKKNRAGQVGKLSMRWTGDWSRFEVVEEEKTYRFYGNSGADRAAGPG
jgi:replicative DNA helicase